MAVVVVRPEPGHGATIASLRAEGMAARSLPFFATRAVAWTAPDPDAIDALLFTSAQGVRLARSAPPPPPPRERRGCRSS